MIKEFVALRSKSYSYIVDESVKEEKKCKGITKATINHTICFQDYKDCLFSGLRQMRKMNSITSDLHQIYTQEMNKIALCSRDDKRIIKNNGIDTYAYGHYKTTSTQLR